MDKTAEASSARVTRAATNGGLGPGLGLLLDEDYFDMESFLTDASMVQVTLTCDAGYSTFVDKNIKVLSDNGEHLESGRKVALPLVTAGILHGLGLVALQTPPALSGTIRSLVAQPEAVQLRALHPFFFEYGMKFANILGDTTLASSLLRAASTRVLRVANLAESQAAAMRHGHAKMTKEDEVFCNGLTLTELDCEDCCIHASTVYQKRLKLFLRIFH